MILTTSYRLLLLGNLVATHCTSVVAAFPGTSLYLGDCGTRFLFFLLERVVFGVMYYFVGWDMNE